MFSPGSRATGAGDPVGREKPDRGAHRSDTVADLARPGAAERARTTIESPDASATFLLPATAADGMWPPAPEARILTPREEVLTLVAADSPAARAAGPARHDELAAVLEITDVAPVAVPHRVRGRLRVGGWLTAVHRGAEYARCARLLSQRHPHAPVAGGGRTILRLEISEVYLEDLWGDAYLEPEALAAATADPSARHETQLLQHLAAAHQTRLRGLGRLLAEHRRPGRADRVVPLALDRFGLRVRIVRPDHGCSDVRFGFAEPADGPEQLQQELLRLFRTADAAGATG